MYKTGTISPLDQSRPSNSNSLMTSYTSLTLLIPSSCAVIVLAVILFLSFNLICKPKHDHPLPPLSSCGDGDGASTIGCTMNRSNSSGHHHGHHSHCANNGSNIYYDNTNGSSHCPAHPPQLEGHRVIHGNDCSMNVQECDESTILSALEHHQQQIHRSHRHTLRAHQLNNQHHSNPKESCLNEMNLIVHGSSSCPGEGDVGQIVGAFVVGNEGDNEAGMTLQSTCTPSKMYYPSPYSIEGSVTTPILKGNNRSSTILIDPSSQQQSMAGYQHHHHSDKQQESIHCHPLSSSSCHPSSSSSNSNANHSQQQPSSSDHPHHTYAIPFPPKWV